MPQPQEHTYDGVAGADERVGSLWTLTRHEQSCRAVYASSTASRLKELMTQFVRGEVDGMRWNVPQQGDAASPVQPCQVSIAHGP